MMMEVAKSQRGSVIRSAVRRTKKMSAAPAKPAMRKATMFHPICRLKRIFESERLAFAQTGIVVHKARSGRKETRYQSECYRRALLAGIPGTEEETLNP